MSCEVPCQNRTQFVFVFVQPELLKKIKTGEFDFDDEVWDTVSPMAKELIRGLLVLDPERRMSLEDYLASPWVQVL